MTDLQPDTLREALQFLIRSDIPAQPKQLLIDAVTQALMLAEAAASVRDTPKKTIREWQPHETEIAATFLHDKVAGSWQHADELVMHLVRELHRDPDDVRSKAIELGFGIGVDYRLAKAHVVVVQAS